MGPGWVEPVSKVLPHAHVTVTRWYSGWIPAFTWLPPFLYAGPILSRPGPGRNGKRPEATAACLAQGPQGSHRFPVLADLEGDVGARGAASGAGHGDGLAPVAPPGPATQ